jgi:hypothetical protein
MPIEYKENGNKVLTFHSLVSLKGWRVKIILRILGFFQDGRTKRWKTSLSKGNEEYPSTQL